MFRATLVGLAALLLAACTTTSSRLSFDEPAKPPAGARILLVKPDIELGLLTAGGVTEPRADWTSQAQALISASVESEMKARSHAYKVFDPDEALEGRIGQLIRLHGAVGQSIGMFNYGLYNLPTKKHGFDWTLGEGAQELGRAYEADYALFLHCRGNYASSGRVATMIVLAAVGASIPLGQQSCFSSLVELESGRIAWFNVAVAGPNADMRQAEGAASLIASLLQDAPL